MDTKGDARGVEIVHLAHHAAADPALWTMVTAQLRDALRAPLVALVEHDLASQRGRISHATGIDESFRALYASRFAAQNAWLRAGARLEAGQVLTGAELMPNWELIRTDFYYRWLRPQHAFHCLLAIAFQCASELKFFLALRPLDTDPFDAADRRMLATLLPQLGCACELSADIQASRGETAALGELIAALPEAILIVDPEIRPLMVNRAAERLLARRDGLRRVSGVVTADSSADTRVLRRLVAQATTSGAGAQATEAAAAGSVTTTAGGLHDEIAIGVASGGPPLLLQIVPLRHAAPGRFGTRKPIVAMIVRPSAWPITELQSAHQLCAFYHMTPAESRLAALICIGRSLLEAAAELRISRNTARTHMKRIYAKTETHRQTDLVRLLAQCNMTSH
jgi:DNA-binding CsgD family transcriptional regulator/PAS domain-containing protein